MTEISQELRTVLERSADALESQWRKGGNAGFYPGSVYISHEIAKNSRCLVDTLAYETAQYARQDVTADNGHYEVEDRLIYEICERVFPAMKSIVREKILARESVRNTYSSDLGEEGRMIPPEVFLDWYDCQCTMPTAMIMLYNDNICQGGEEAAEIVRLTIKEL